MRVGAGASGEILAPASAPRHARTYGTKKIHRAGCAFVHLSPELSASALRLRPTALRSGFDLLALRARCKSKPRRCGDGVQGVSKRALPQFAETSLCACRVSTSCHVLQRGQKNSPSRLRFCPPPPGTFGFRLAASPTALRSGFDLLALRARCKGKPTVSDLSRQEGRGVEKHALCEWDLGKSCGFHATRSSERGVEAREQRRHVVEAARLVQRLDRARRCGGSSRSRSAPCRGRRSRTCARRRAARAPPSPAGASSRSSPRTKPSVPSSTYHASSSLRCRCSGAIGRSAELSPASVHSASTKSVPSTGACRRGGTITARSPAGPPDVSPQLSITSITVHAGRNRESGGLEPSGQRLDGCERGDGDGHPPAERRPAPAGRRGRGARQSCASPS